MPDGTILTAYYPEHSDILPHQDFYEGGYVIPSQYANYSQYGSIDVAYLVANLATAGEDLAHYRIVASNGNYRAVGTTVAVGYNNGVIKPSNTNYYYPFTYEEITTVTITFDLVEYLTNVAVINVYEVCYDDVRNITTSNGHTN